MMYSSSSLTRTFWDTANAEEMAESEAEYQRLVRALKPVTTHNTIARKRVIPSPGDPREARVQEEGGSVSKLTSEDDADTIVDATKQGQAPSYGTEGLPAGGQENFDTSALTTSQQPSRGRLWKWLSSSWGPFSSRREPDKAGIRPGQHKGQAAEHIGADPSDTDVARAEGIVGVVDQSRHKANNADAGLLRPDSNCPMGGGVNLEECVQRKRKRTLTESWGGVRVDAADSRGAPMMKKVRLTEANRG